MHATRDRKIGAGCAEVYLGWSGMLASGLLLRLWELISLRYVGSSIRADREWNDHLRVVGDNDGGDGAHLLKSALRLDGPRRIHWSQRTPRDDTSLAILEVSNSWMEQNSALHTFKTLLNQPSRPLGLVPLNSLNLSSVSLLPLPLAPVVCSFDASSSFFLEPVN